MMAAGGAGLVAGASGTGEAAAATVPAKVVHHVFFWLKNVDSTAEIPHPNYPDLNLPPLELKSTLAMLGPSLTYDSRNSSLNPSRGSYVTAFWTFGSKFLGSDFSHDKLQVGANFYAPVGRCTR